MSPDIYSSALPLVVLSEKDIPGVDLDEPLQNHSMPALQWWLLSYGIQDPTIWKKFRLI